MSLLTPAEARARYAAALRVRPRGVETVPVAAALGRVLARDLVSSDDIPPFDRSAVDGWAVRSADVAGATPERPVQLTIRGEVHMGAAAEVPVTPGGAVRIPTGGMLPDGADAIVMQEHADLAGRDLHVRRAVRPRENVVRRGEDVRTGAVVLHRGRRLRPADLGILSGLGLVEVEVVFPPRVAILGTGDEVVAPGGPLRPGQVRDMNGPALAGAVQEAGGVATFAGVLPDEGPVVEAALRRAVADFDMVLVSGGSSVGERDVVVDAIRALGPPGIIVHGIAVRPGKPTALAIAGDTPVIGLPGNPVSALVIFDLFARPVLEQLLGIDPAARPWDVVRARVAARLPAAENREDHRRVRLESRPDGIWAVPLPAGSQILTSLTGADGIVVVPPGSAGFAEGDPVEVRLL